MADWLSSAWQSPEQLKSLHTGLGVIVVALMIFTAILSGANYFVGIRRDRLEAARREQREKEQSAREGKLRDEVTRLALEAGRPANGRKLNSEQIAAIAAAISPFTGETVALLYPNGKEEARFFATDFLEAFRQAKWVRAHKHELESESWWEPPEGIWIQAQTEEDLAKPAVIKLTEAFREIGLNPRLRATDKVRGITVIIGVEPQ